MKFTINKSSSMTHWLIFFHAIAILAAYQNALDLKIRIILIFLVLTSLLFYLKREFEFRPFSIRYNVIYGWEIAYSESDYFAIEVLPSTVLTTHLILLHFNLQKKTKQSIIIFRDALIKDEFRKLMIQLKISGLKNIS